MEESIRKSAVFSVLSVVEDIPDRRVGIIRSVFRYQNIPKGKHRVWFSSGAACDPRVACRGGVIHFLKESALYGLALEVASVVGSAVDLLIDPLQLSEREDFVEATACY